MRNLIDIVDFSVDELKELMDTACDIAKHPKKYAKRCKSKKLATKRRFWVEIQST